MSILRDQNINNLGEGFGVARLNPFPVFEDQAAETYWNGYEYAPAGLGGQFVATTPGDRLTPNGEETINGAAGDFSYGPAVKMSNSQNSILTAMASMIAARGGGNFKDKTGPQQMKATFSKSDSLRSAKDTNKIVGMDQVSSGVAVAQYTSDAEYGARYTPVVEGTLAKKTGALESISVDGVDKTDEVSFEDFGDLNNDGQYNLFDFFIFADDATAAGRQGKDDQGRTTFSGGGDHMMNTNKGLSNQVGIQRLVSNGTL